MAIPSCILHGAVAHHRAFVEGAAAVSHSWGQGLMQLYMARNSSHTAKHVIEVMGFEHGRCSHVSMVF